MIVSKIAKMGSEDKFAVFIDDVLKMILSGQTILDLGISVGREVSDEDIEKFTSYADNEKLYMSVLRYINLRLRSEGEILSYLKRKKATPAQISQIMQRLNNLGLINDEFFVKAYLHDKLMLRPSSKRKLIYELRKKKISEDIIESSLKNEQINDIDNLKRTIETKRNQSKYKDDLKLMQYLVRIGYNYADVKETLAALKQPE